MHTNTMSVFEVLEEIHVDDPNPQLILGRCVAVALWMQEEDDAPGQDLQQMLTITQPNGDTREFPTNFSFKSTSARHRIMNRMEGLPVNGLGQLRFELSLNGLHAATHTVDVTVKPGSGSGFLIQMPPSAGVGDRKKE